MDWNDWFGKGRKITFSQPDYRSDPWLKPHIEDEADDFAAVVCAEIDRVLNGGDRE